MTPAAEVLGRLEAAGLHIRAEAGKLIARPKEAVTEDLRALMRAHKAELLSVLAGVPEHAHADGPGDPAPALAPEGRAECMRCSHLTMRIEIREGTRRVFWWRCVRGHEQLEARNFGERVLIAPPGCHDFEQWQPGAR